MIIIAIQMCKKIDKEIDLLCQMIMNNIEIKQTSDRIFLFTLLERTYFKNIPRDHNFAT